MNVMGMMLPMLRPVLAFAQVAEKTAEKAVNAVNAAAAEVSAKAAESGASATAGTEQLLLLITIFVLAIFVGVEIITKIPPTLHTPLMSGSNAISGITLIGALLATGAGEGGFATFLGFVAVVFATVNVVGGFLVTHRMLEMFRKKK